MHFRQPTPSQLTTLRSGTAEDRIALFRNRHTHDSVRRLAVTDPDPLVRAEAASSAHQDTTRMLFLGDANDGVVVAALWNMRSDAVRMKFMGHANEQVRIAAATNISSSFYLEALAKTQQPPAVALVIAQRLAYIKQWEASRRGAAIP
jgi:hypothetical protein